MKIPWLVGVAFLSVAIGAEVQYGEKSQVRFASVEQGRQVLTNRDDFVARLSGFDRAARLKTDRTVSEAEFLGFVAKNVLEFNDREIARIEGSLKKLQPKIQALNLDLPGTVLLIKTTGKEEGEAAYTRANAIVLPEKKIGAGGDGTLEDLICHELFHVASRHDAKMKERLYAAIGFQKCEEAPLPAGMMRITNPDAPRNDHWIRLTKGGMAISAIPILFAKPQIYDPKKGGDFFNYLQFKMLAVKLTGGKTVLDAENPEPLDLSSLEGFFPQVGQNTRYIIHPEEILADNFVLLVNGNKEMKSPEVLQRMREALAGR